MNTIRFYLTMSLVLTFMVTSAQNIKLPKINFFNSSEYTIEAEITDYITYKYTIKKSGDNSSTQEFTIRPNTLENFRENFKKYFTKLDPSTTKSSTDIDLEVSRLFYFFTGSDIVANTLDLEPKAGSLNVNKNVKISIDLSSPNNSRARKDYVKLELGSANRKNGFLVFGSRSRYEIPDPAGPPNKIKTSRKRAKAQFKRDWDQKQLDLINTDLLKLQQNICKGYVEIQKLETSNKSLRSTLNNETKILEKIRGEIDDLKKNTRKSLSTDWTAFMASLNLFYTDETNLFHGPIIQITPTISEDIHMLNDYKKKLTDIYRKITTVIAPLPQETKERITPLINSRGQTSQFSGFQELLTIRTDSIDILRGLIRGTANPIVTLDQTYQALLSQNLKLDYSKWDKPIPNGFTGIDVATINTKVQELETKTSNLANSHYDQDIDSNNGKIKKYKDSVAVFNADATKKTLERPENNFIVKDIQFEFNEGYLENVVVLGEVGDSEFTCPNGEKKNIASSGGKLKFVNTSPFGFSRKMDYSRLKSEKLYSIGGANKISYKLDWKELVPMYVEELEVDRRDFSPKDQKVRIQFEKDENSKIVELKKTETKKLIEAHVYSDFLGFADTKAPNGIIQTEVEKRLNLATHRNQWSWFRYNRINSGALEYLELAIAISKLEANNKSLLLNTTDKTIAGVYSPIKYTSTLELRRHEKFSAGFDLNLFLLDLTGIKSTIRINGGVRYGLVSIIDSLKTLNGQGVLVKNPVANTIELSTYRIYPKVIWEFLTDERLSFKVSYTHNWYYARSNYFQQVSNVDDFKINETLENNRHAYNNVQLSATFQPNGKTDNKLFFRWNHFWQQGFWNTTFDQIQVGYSFFITSQFKSPKPD